VGRLGGDEFVMIGPAVPTPAAAGALAGRVMRAIQEPVGLGGRPLIPSVSIGVALSAPDDSPDSVLAAADRALYTAKAGSRGRWQLALPGTAHI